MTYVREAVIAAITASAMPSPPSGSEADKFLSRRCGLFVTLKKNMELRGCMGRLTSEEPLADTIPEVASLSALSDPRFSPVAFEECDELAIELSILTPPTPIGSPDDVKVGVDGIIVSGKGKRGCYLPQVGSETGWSAREFVAHCLLEKAGLPADAVDNGTATIEVFQAEVYRTEK